jgi:hypothetical protein
LISTDRQFNSSFFDPLCGGGLFSIIFNTFGFLDILKLIFFILPAFGINYNAFLSLVTNYSLSLSNNIISPFSSIDCGFNKSSIVWGHHMFIVGFDSLLLNCTSSYSYNSIAIPTGISSSSNNLFSSDINSSSNADTNSYDCVIDNVTIPNLCSTGVSDINFKSSHSSRSIKYSKSSITISSSTTSYSYSRSSNSNSSNN